MSKVYLRAAAVLFTYLFLQVSVSHSTVITVNTDDDVISAIDLQCSLREAIISANTDPFGVIIAPPGECAPGSGDDEIIFDPSTDGLPLSILISGTDEDSAATGDFDISGNLTITGNGTGNTIVDGNFLDRVFHIIGSGTTVIMTGLSITQGFLGEAGGAGIFNGGALTLDTVNINLNFVTGTTSSATGGGITNTGTLDITDTIIDGNQADRGGGIFTNNTLTISSSSVLNNTARAGGGITNFGDVTVTNSTFSGNEATNNGGAIANSVAGPSIGVVDILNSTIAQNTAPDTLGGGILNSGTLSVRNTILANNTGGDCGLLAPIASEGNNLDSDGTCALSEPTDVSNTDPMLDGLSFNGGSTPSHALMPGSPAIDAGGNLSCPPLDQRGVARPQDGLDDGFPVCDMGALEMLIAELSTPASGGTGGAAGGCALAQSSQSGPYSPLYLLVPAFVLWRRLRRKSPVYGDT